MLFFPWPGDDGQGKEPPRSDGNFLLFSKLFALEVRILKKLPGGLQSFARSPSPDRAKKDSLCASVVRSSYIFLLEAKAYDEGS